MTSTLASSLLWTSRSLASVKMDSDDEPFSSQFVLSILRVLTSWFLLIGFWISTPMLTCRISLSRKHHRLTLVTSASCGRLASRIGDRLGSSWWKVFEKIIFVIYFQAEEQRDAEMEKCLDWIIAAYGTLCLYGTLLQAISRLTRAKLQTACSRHLGFQDSQWIASMFPSTVWSQHQQRCLCDGWVVQALQRGFEQGGAPRCQVLERALQQGREAGARLYGGESQVLRNLNWLARCTGWDLEISAEVWQWQWAARQI